jgi:hypothetical protein
MRKLSHLSCESLHLSHLLHISCKSLRIERMSMGILPSSPDNSKSISQVRLILAEETPLATDLINLVIDYLPRQERLIRKWGAREQFYYPHEVTILDGKVYITDSHNHRVRVFDEQGNFIREWGSFGSHASDLASQMENVKREAKDGQFSVPIGIAIWPKRNEIYVSDCLNHRIQVFSQDGKFIRKWGRRSGPKREHGCFQQPCGLAILSNELYVADYENYRIQVFLLPSQDDHLEKDQGDYNNLPKEITFLRAWDLKWNSDKGERQALPCGLTITNQCVYVTDLANYQVHVFTREGEYLQKWRLDGPKERYKSYHRPCGIAASSFSEIYITDYHSHETKVFSAKGEYLRKLNSPMAYPYGLAVSRTKQAEMVYLINYHDHCVYVFEIVLE